MSRRAQTAQPSAVVQRPAQPSRTKTAPAAMGPSAYFRVMMFAEERDKEQEAKEFMRKVQKRANHSRRARLTERSNASTHRSHGPDRPDTGSSTYSIRSALSTASSFLPNRLRAVDASEAATARCQTILQRLVPGTLADAFRENAPDATRATKQQFQQVLQSLLSYPGDQDFDILWKRFDPGHLGSADFEEFAAQMEHNGSISRPCTGMSSGSRSLTKRLASRVSTARSSSYKY